MERCSVISYVSMFVESYALQSFLVKLQWGSDQVMGDQDWAAGLTDHTEFLGPKIYTL